ncbi:hypothetical protein FGIG_02328 [Fasciola gigantica]|uniref:Protein root UVB sensitive/RUS domain-containing protein n=1 Tax=Fasciola gigantica TaxID=46835 RepID=A0A504YW94_FASGI|nr:hypothetical protein FGIG_02328 [Fasciola gigantica]
MAIRKIGFECYGEEQPRPIFADFNYRDRSWSADSILSLFKKVFLPKGYPHSVSSDYMEYQIWDTIQALASSVTGALAAQAVLIGVGVGDAQATILGASLSWMLKNGSGMIGKILFVGIQGSQLDCDCKRWRLLADIINDGALFLELCSPFTPMLFVPLVCAADIMKSIVSVAGGATRAAVIQHHAVDNNMADVAAKDGSQESLSNLLALLFNLCAVYIVTGNWALIWFGFILLTGVHLYANYRAVRCLRLTTFNRNRFTIATQCWLTTRLGSSSIWSTSPDSKNHRFPSVEWVNWQEPVLRSVATPHINLGCSVHALPEEGKSQLSTLICLFVREQYILYCADWKQITLGQLDHSPHVYIVLMRNCEPQAQLLAMLHAELLTALVRVNHS